MATVERGSIKTGAIRNSLFSNVIVLESLIEGTDIKIGKPISTNEIHRVSWYVKGDWDELSGDLKMGIFAQDQRRNKPVDLHFLTLPLSDNNITICRSPIESRDLENFLFYKLSVGELGIENRAVKDWGEWQEIRPTLFKKDDNKILAHSDLTIHKEDIVHFEETAFEYFIQAFGEGYRWATEEEVRLCREANTPGSVNSFEISNKVIPRGLPNSVNEYGFDSSVSSSGRWIVKEN